MVSNGRGPKRPARLPANGENAASISGSGSSAAPAIEAEYRHQRAELLILLQWWLRDVWFHTLAAGEEQKTLSSIATICNPESWFVLGPYTMKKLGNPGSIDPR